MISLAHRSHRDAERKLNNTYMAEKRDEGILEWKDYIWRKYLCWVVGMEKYRYWKNTGVYYISNDTIS